MQQQKIHTGRGHSIYSCCPYFLKESLLTSAGRDVQVPDCKGRAILIPFAVIVTPLLCPGCLDTWMRKYTRDLQDDTHSSSCLCPNGEGMRRTFVHM